MRHALVFTSFFALCACSSPGGSSDGGSTCPAPSGAGTTHGGDNITTDTTWTAAGSPHIVSFGFKIVAGATLTIEPCSELRMGPYGITVEGRLVATGEATKPIRIHAADPAKPWSYLRFMAGTGTLSYVSLEDAGNSSDPNGLATLETRGDGTKPRQELVHLDHVTIKNSQQYGLSFRSGATLTADSSDVTVTGATLGAVRTNPRLAGNIPSGSYTGNTVDEIVVMAEDYLTDDTTWHARGVPYHVGNTTTGAGGDMRVGSDYTGSRRSVLTIEPGVTVKMSHSSRILMAKDIDHATGVLVAQGTADKPIVFTSASPSPAAGDWVGLWFDWPDAADRLDHVRVEYAGGPSLAKSFHCDLQGGLSEEEDAAVLLFATTWTPFITNSSFLASAGYGIDRAWSGDLVDFLPTNDFQQMARCKQSYPRQTNGGCPATVPCP
jgi:hypothetical protein